MRFREELVLPHSQATHTSLPRGRKGEGPLADSLFHGPSNGSVGEIEKAKNPEIRKCPDPETPETPGGTHADKDRVREELERVAHSDPESGREAMAKVTALRTLERLDQPPRKEPPPPPDDCHPQPGSVMEELDRADPNATPEMRRRWFKTLWELGMLNDEGYYEEQSS